MLREKIMYVDELTPEGGIVISGSGNFELLYRKIPEIISSVLGVPKKEVLEKKFVKRENSVSVVWEFIKLVDQFSYYHFELSAKFSGNAVIITITGKLKTEFHRESLWERNFLYDLARTLWYEFVYSKKRKLILDEGRALASFIANSIKSLMR